jgi:hypothetical protein
MNALDNSKEELKATDLFIEEQKKRIE